MVRKDNVRFIRLGEFHKPVLDFFNGVIDGCFYFVGVAEHALRVQHIEWIGRQQCVLNFRKFLVM